MDPAQIIAYGLYLLTGYLIGSINFAVLVAKNHGVNILEEGSGNPGATNVKRVLGKGAGNLVFGLDVFKGVLGTFLPFFLIWCLNTRVEGRLDDFTKVLNDPNTDSIFITSFVATLIGHCYSVFLGFKGGKGIASTIGGLAIILPIPILVGVVVWVIAFYNTKYVSVASMLLGVSLPITCWVVNASNTLIIFATVLAFFNLWNHRTNIQRLQEGTESRFGSHKK
ncbi:MAG: glycerol-3-phosphate 1-O-acyltransferase PlsY [Opitutales bacterium]|nr:glycerol-3-phosphate 1-O-acyltransferase PlsY [Opitutales bacterium]